MATTDMLAVADAVDKGGVTFVLVLVLLGVGYLYLLERRRNDKLSLGLIENNKEMMNALHDVDTSVQSFKDVLLGLRPFIEELARDRRRR